MFGGDIYTVSGSIPNGAGIMLLRCLLTSHEAGCARYIAEAFHAIMLVDPVHLRGGVPE